MSEIESLREENERLKTVVFKLQEIISVCHFCANRPDVPEPWYAPKAEPEHSGLYRITTTTASGEDLDILGEDYVKRVRGESDAAYRVRILTFLHSRPRDAE